MAAAAQAAEDFRARINLAAVAAARFGAAGTNAPTDFFAAAAHLNSLHHPHLAMAAAAQQHQQQHPALPQLGQGAVNTEISGDDMSESGSVSGSATGGRDQYEGDAGKAIRLFDSVFE